VTSLRLTRMPEKKRTETGGGKASEVRDNGAELKRAQPEVGGVGIVFDSKRKAKTRGSVKSLTRRGSKNPSNNMFAGRKERSHQNEPQRGGKNSPAKQLGVKVITSRLASMTEQKD